MVVDSHNMELDAAVNAALEVLVTADADVSFWMKRYKQCVEDVHQLIEALPAQEVESAPRYRLLQQVLQDTRSGLDYAVRRASDARQELDSARQFYLAARTSAPASAADAAPLVTARAAEANSAPFRIRSNAAPASIVSQQSYTVQTQPLTVYPAASSNGPSYGEPQQPAPPVPRPVRAVPVPRPTSAPVADAPPTSAPVPRPTRASSDMLPPSNEAEAATERQGPLMPRALKRSGPKIPYLVPPKRFKYARAFKWADNKMHHFPEDFKIPVCSLASMWQFWLCGDDDTKYPPFRILVASELQEGRTRRMLSSLRFVMLEIESRVLEQDAWVDKPSRGDAVKMLESVRESIGVRPGAKRNERHPVEDLQWTSLDRILRDQKRRQSEEECEEEMMNASPPVLATALVVCRGSLGALGVESLSHVVSRVDEYLNTFSKNWTVARACEKGLSKRGLVYLSVRDPDWGNGQHAAYVAVKKNFLHVLQWLNEFYPDRTSWGSRQDRCFLNTAAERRHLAVLQWLHANRNEGCTAFAMGIAAANGQLEMVEWLHQNRREGCTKQAMDDAAENGHLEVVEWLHSNRKEGCTEDAMDNAAANGHLEIIRFLHDHRDEGCTSAALNLAAAHGHLEIVQWLCTNRKEGRLETAMRSAAENGQLAVAEWLCDEVSRKQRRCESTIRSAARIAKESGHSDVAELLEHKTLVHVVCRECLHSCEVKSLSRIEKRIDDYLDTFSSRCTVRRACHTGFSRRALEYLSARDPEWGNGRKIAEHAATKGFLHVIEWIGECFPDRTEWRTADNDPLMDIAAEFNHLSILQWLHANRTEGCTTEAMDRAAAVGNLEVVRWLHLFRKEGCTKQAMNAAAAYGHLDVVEWLHENRPEGCDKSAVSAAAANGHLAVVRFLLENRREGSTGDAMCQAAANGHLEMAQWLYVNRGDSHAGAALRRAAEKGHAEVVEWLYWIVSDERRGASIIQDAEKLALKNGHKKVARQLDKSKRQREPKEKPKKRTKRRRRRY
ncbi:putative ankyrin repeat protein [Phytophthora citrophthora]|uniref:Ankyrin repeat protein n=1 Tax=Phytophthora citrophthora TaxID=4793 RepID=A0AAD9GAS8_9STRA|nr:putative ankyrin repeat protein [Phytophthora citrophthora]